jgi:hypothetical protein
MKDRELVLIGAGAFLTVLCLLIPWPFALRVGVGMALLLFFTAFALWPVGPEHLTVEEALFRTIRRARRPRKYALTGAREPLAVPPRGRLISAPAVPEDPLPAPASRSGSVPASADFVYTPGPVAWNELDFQPVVQIWLGVVGVYFIYWLVQGGTREIGAWIVTFIK